MTTFQKIAIGLLGLKNPEMFIPMSKPPQESSPKTELSCGPNGPISVQLRDGGRGLMRALRFMVATLAIDSRTVPLADNSELSRDLRARAGRLSRSNED